MAVIDYQILDLGLVLYKNVIPESKRAIELINELSERMSHNEHEQAGGWTASANWFPWHDEDKAKPFCYKFGIFREPADGDFYSKEIKEIGDILYGGLDRAFKHYSTILYPLAANSVKAEEPNGEVLRYEADGGHLPAHQDLGNSSRLISTVSYLNDDYTGGEIEFKQSNALIKPDAGDIVFFASNYLFMHEVKPITSGTRYAMPHWYHHLKNIRLSDGEE